MTYLRPDPATDLDHARALRVLAAWLSADRAALDMVLDEVMADDRPDSVAALLFHTLDQFRRILGAAEVDTDDLLVDLRRGVATYTARAES